MPVVNGGLFGLVVGFVMLALSLRAIRVEPTARIGLVLAIGAISGSAAVIATDNKLATVLSVVACSIAAAVFTVFLIVAIRDEEMDLPTASMILLCALGPATTAVQGAFQLGFASSVSVRIVELICFIMMLAAGTLFIRANTKSS